ncbi:MAG TPA: hypothetical protein VGR78_15060 [Verrucomicrobiae bacterium]|jgi:TolA-binding protein|nr:hypothetical protein [Verrucomicrobiae bacterium]
MKSNLVFALIFAAIAAGLTGFLLQQKASSRMNAQAADFERQASDLHTQAVQLEARLNQTEQERDKFKTEAAEVHKLRGEIAALKNANKDLEKRATQAAQASAKASGKPAQPAQKLPDPASFSNYADMGAFASTLRTKAFQNALTPEEREWLQRLKPDLEKLEHSPADFATFQASLIQSAAGIDDPQKLDRIRDTIQKVYENAVSRGLDIPSRPSDDPNWTQQRHQLDQRGTKVVENLMSDTEKAAFGRSFLGIMGVDLGTGVDKSLYPPGFLGENIKTQ